jgi:hypothetical protein
MGEKRLPGLVSLLKDAVSWNAHEADWFNYYLVHDTGNGIAVVLLDVSSI